MSYKTVIEWTDETGAHVREFNSPTVMIGRDPANNLVLNNPKISRHSGFISPCTYNHKLRSFTNGIVTNPTILFKKSSSPRVLRDREEVLLEEGDYIFIGQHVKVKLLRFE